LAQEKSGGKRGTKRQETREEGREKEAKRREEEKERARKPGRNIVNKPAAIHAVSSFNACYICANIPVPVLVL
jgi:hypothetical protein